MVQLAPIYSSTNRIKFTDIPEKYAIPRGYRAKQSEVHSAVVTYVFEHYKNTKKYRQTVVDALNCLTFCIMQNSPPPFNWVSTNPLDTMPEMDMNLVKDSLGAFFLTADAIDWDVPVSDESSHLDNLLTRIPTSEDKSSSEDKSIKSNPSTVVSASVLNKPLSKVKSSQKKEIARSASSSVLTPKEDLYIQPPRCPRFDVSKVWMSANINGDSLAIYTTLPEIPTKQNEISVTTNADSMTDSEFIALYPNHVIHTRSPKMYDKYDELEYDEDLGCIIPIGNFTSKQVRDNIVKYPHLYRLRKFGPDNSIVKFFSSIEIEGELIPIEEIWDSLPESKLMPRDAEFVKEYAVRRYLLEESVGIKHKYNIVGSLDPFLTLFMPQSEYIKRGYTDVLGIAKQCVTSRINYKRSRNPILRRIEEANG